MENTLEKKLEWKTRTQAPPPYELMQKTTTIVARLEEMTIVRLFVSRQTMAYYILFANITHRHLSTF